MKKGQAATATAERERRILIAEARTGTHHSDATRDRMSKSQRRAQRKRRANERQRSLDAALYRAASRLGEDIEIFRP